MSGKGPEHKIRSLRWRVTAKTAEEAFVWRALLRDRGDDLLLPALERQLDAAVRAGETLRLPRLHLRLRVQSLNDLALRLPEAIRKQLCDVGPTSPTSASVAAEVEAGAQPTDAAGVEAECLWSYLRRGVLPWTAAGSSDELTASLMAARAWLWAEILDVLRRQRQTPSVLYRLFQLIPQAEIAAALDDCLDLVRLDGTRDMVAAWLQALGSEATGCCRHARLGMMASFLAPATGAEVRAAAREASFLLAEMVASVVATCERSQVASWLAVLSPDATAFFSPFLLQEVREEAPRKISGRQSVPRHSPALHPGSGGVPVGNEEWSIGTPSVVAAMPPVLARQAGHPPPEAARDLYPLRVAQAGLVLLHPYLCRLLVHCNLMEPGGKMLPPFALPRVAALLHYLATGREEVMEFELGLIKILLGLDPLTPLPVVEGLLAEADKVEAQALLTAVVTHWSALKKTSAQGLRASFLERPGILREIDGGWRLNVERRGWDVLLDQLPWSLSLVRLPWMHRFIVVEW